MSDIKCILLPLLTLLSVLYVHCHVSYVLEVDQEGDEIRFRDTRIPNARQILDQRLHQNRIRLQDFVYVAKPYQSLRSEMQNSSCNGENCHTATEIISFRQSNHRMDLIPTGLRSIRTTSVRLERVLDQKKRRRVEDSRINKEQMIRAPFRDHRINDSEERNNRVGRNNIIEELRRRRISREEIRGSNVRAERNLGMRRERIGRFVSVNRFRARNERSRRDFQIYSADQARDLKPRIDTDNESVRRQSYSLTRNRLVRREVNRRQESHRERTRELTRTQVTARRDLGKLIRRGEYFEFNEIRGKYDVNFNQHQDSVAPQANEENSRTSDPRRTFLGSLSLYGRFFSSKLDVTSCGITVFAGMLIYDFIGELTQKQGKPYQMSGGKLIDGLILATKKAVIHI